jgi:5-methyltetrahydrofolate--homocysteine methyltransferase
MVPTEKILDAAKEHDVDVIGLSGLITPSLEEMVNVAAELEKNGFDTPLLIGGATTSKIHTAVKIEPAYHGPVIHVLDASRSVGVVNQLLSKNKDGYVKGIREEYNKLREKRGSGPKKEYVPLQEARERKFKINWDNSPIYKPNQMGLQVIEDLPMDVLFDYIDWTFFFHAWELRGKYPAIFDHPEKGKEARQLFDDAQLMLSDIVNKKMLQAKGVFGLYPANSVGDDIEVYTDESKKKLLTTFHHLRQQNVREEYDHFYCLSDFVAPKESGITDYMGAFAVTAGLGIEKWLKHFEEENDDYSSILLKALADRLAEAFAEYLHEKVRTEYWGYAPAEKLDRQELIREKYQGIRPALGYPACPEHSEKRDLFDALKAEKNTGIELTEHFAMYPTAAVSGQYFAHPDSRYFNLGKISKDQVEDYARRKGIPLEQAEKWLAANINYG